MNLIDAGIIILLLTGLVVGFKRGVIHETVSAVSFFASIVIAFLFKNMISELLYTYLPFFKFGGVIKGVTVLNLVLYEVIAFLIALSIVVVLFRIVIMITKVIEKFLKFTLILGIPSKILGAVVGVIESYMWIFIILYIVSLPLFSFDLSGSKYRTKILEQTPILSSFTDEYMDVVDEFTDLKDKYNDSSNATEFNKETLDLLLKYDIVTIDSVDQLIEDDKLKIDNIEEVLVKYRD